MAAPFYHVSDYLPPSLSLPATSRLRGGAISNFAVSDTSAVTNCTISENAASTDGGAIFIQSSGATGSTIEFTGNSIERNNAIRGGAVFAGPAPGNTTLLIHDNTIADNAVTQQGGAVFLASSTAPKTTISSSTISGNTARTHGGGVFVNGTRDVSIVDCMIVGNSSLRSARDVAGASTARWEISPSLAAQSPEIPPLRAVGSTADKRAGCQLQHH